MGLLTQEDLNIRMKMSLRDKIDTSSERIEKWYDHWGGRYIQLFLVEKIH